MSLSNSRGSSRSRNYELCLLLLPRARKARGFLSPNKKGAADKAAAFFIDEPSMRRTMPASS